MGGFELIIWLAIIVFSILRGLQNKKAPAPGSKSPDSPATDPFQDAIREIEAALRGRVEEPASSDTASSPSTFQDASREPRPRKVRPREPEFHSMESPISSRNLESESGFKESYSSKILESKTTYEDIFPKSTYYDDDFKHAHPEPEVAKKAIGRNKRSHSIRTRLKNKEDLVDAIVLQTILNRRSFPPRRH